MPALMPTIRSQDIGRMDLDGCDSVNRSQLEPRNWYCGCKRSFDFVLALVLLVILAPIIAICILLVRLTSRGPGLYLQPRAGLNGRVYMIFKIRTMYHNLERRRGPQWSLAGDPRVTPLGRFLRRSHLDELPQLWNVVKGDMSLVGPRPEWLEYVPGFSQAIPRYRERLNVQPGVTGLAQVQLPADTNLNDVRRKVVYDLYYIQHGGLWLDLRIILATVGKVLGLPFRLTGAILRLPSASVVEGDATSGGESSRPLLNLTPSV